jgi:hypothetical protein
MREAHFLEQVATLARLRGWFVAHFRNARVRGGWRTACQFDAVGFPDLLMLRRDRQVAAELKVGRNKPTQLQLDWLERFEEVGESYLWYPDDWNRIEEVLA